MSPSLQPTSKYPDERGYYIPLFNQMTGVNVSYSKEGVIRGMHFQEGKCAQAKTVHVLDGLIEDVVLDLRTRQVYSFIMKEGDTLYVPRGYAHGFEALTDSRIIYGVDNFYYPSAERIIRYDTIDHKWKRKLPTLSYKDANAKSIDEVLMGGQE